MTQSPPPIKDETAVLPKPLTALPQLTSLLALALAFAYFVGWAKSTSYLTELGAPWAAHLLTPYRLLHESSGLVITMLAAGVVAGYVLHFKLLKPDTVYLIGNGQAVLAAIPLLIEKFKLHDPLAANITNVALYAGPVFAIWMVAGWAARLRAGPHGVVLLWLI